MLAGVIKIKKEIRAWIIFFIIVLILSGITAFPVEKELSWVCSWWPEQNSMFYKWLYICYQAMKDTNDRYPYLAFD